MNPRNPEGVHAALGRAEIRAATAPIVALEPGATIEVVGNVQGDDPALTHARWALAGVDPKGTRSRWTAAARSSPACSRTAAG